MTKARVEPTSRTFSIQPTMVTFSPALESRSSLQVCVLDWNMLILPPNYSIYNGNYFLSSAATASRGTSRSALSAMSRSFTTPRASSSSAMVTT